MRLVKARLWVPASGSGDAIWSLCSRNWTKNIRFSFVEIIMLLHYIFLCTC